ncbi:helix-turn-helix domain-containing protein [Bacillus sp. AFS017336]|uniref:helix-turn-helix domain-containing protein n=1 Tax=Bacillus sp. AFS017336 TaxID=2033489 RepID=UPI000BF1D830|nr:helix-turn-helix transcriptional regulator [Bacillus sp. AFS017336]PEL12698.1 transcriptional regulator [Bacillus sp. AFS017336]
MLKENLRRLRISKKLTQEDVAKKLEISRQRYSNYENGVRQPDQEMLTKIADLFEVSVDYILGREETGGNPLAQIQKLVEEHGIENISFFDIEKWKNLSPAEIELVKQHFEMVAKMAEQRNK